MEGKVIEDKVERVIVRVFGGVHNVMGCWNRKEVWPNNDGLKMSLPASCLSTFDADGLTRLVVAAHDECVRVEIVGGGPRRVTVTFHVREGREGCYYQKHPTMEQALAEIRKHYDTEGKPVSETTEKEA